MTEALAAARPVTPDELSLVKNTVAQGATDAELKLFLFDCARQGVHPLDRLLHFTKRNGKYTPITSIDFMRIRAAESGEMAGSDDPRFSFLHPTGAPDEATVTVYRITQGQRFAYSATARWKEYYPGDGPPGFMWRKMPHTMLGKCAEALALRKGFPRQLAGLYAKEEMDQADALARSDRPLVVEPVPPAATATPAADVLEPAEAPTLAPRAAVTIAKVDIQPTKNKAVNRYSITLSTGAIVNTINEWLASLAQDAQTNHWPMFIKTKETKFGVDLVGMQRADAEITAIEPPPDEEDLPF